jgi:hypothetical protein
MAVAADNLPLGHERWAKVPRSRTEDPTLPDGEYRLLNFLTDHGTNDRGSQGWFSCPVDFMADTLKVTPRTIQNRLRGLEAKGRIQVEVRHLPNGWQLTNRYLVLEGVQQVSPLPNRTKRVSPGKQGVKVVSPKEEHRTTRSIRPSSSVLTSNRHRQRGNSQTGHRPEPLSLDEFKKKRKTKQAQSNPPALGGASGSPRAYGSLTLKDKNEADERFLQQRGFYPRNEREEQTAVELLNAAG